MGLNLSRPMLDGSAVFEKSCYLIISLAETGRIKWWKIDGSESESPHATQSRNVGYSKLIQIIIFQQNLEIDRAGRSSMGRLRFSPVKKWLIITILFIMFENLALDKMSFPFMVFIILFWNFLLVGVCIWSPRGRAFCISSGARLSESFIFICT